VTPYRLGAEEADAAGRLIAAAFDPAPMMAFLFPDAQRRARLLPCYFAVMTRLAVRTGHAFGLGYPLQASALWLPPGGEEPPEEIREEAGVPAFVALLDEGETERAVALGAQLEAMAARSIAGPHWYLAYAAVAPARQGRGLGTTLLRHNLGQLAATGLPCYLESADATNLPFYDRLGFQIVETGRVPESQLDVWLLRRDAGSPSPANAIAGDAGAGSAAEAGCSRSKTSPPATA
jgi:GNAT superfamily N-acetyltransferase